MANDFMTGLLAGFSERLQQNQQERTLRERYKMQQSVQEELTKREDKKKRDAIKNIADAIEASKMKGRPDFSYPAGPGPQEANVDYSQPMLDPTQAMLKILQESEIAPQAAKLGMDALSESGQPEQVGVTPIMTDKGIVLAPQKVAPKEAGSVLPFIKSQAEKKQSDLRAALDSGIITKEEYKNKLLSTGGVKVENILKVPTPQEIERYADVRSALGDVRRVRSLLNLNEGGTFDWKTAVSAKFNLPTSKARAVKSAMFNSMDVLMRGRTGAQINAQELDKYTSGFGYQIGDTKAVMQFKMNRLEEIFNIQEAILRPGLTPDEKLAETIELLENGLADIEAFKQRTSGEAVGVPGSDLKAKYGLE